MLKKELEQKAVDRFKAFVAESTHWPALFKSVCDTLLGFVGTVVNLFEFLDYCNPFQLRRHSERRLRAVSAVVQRVLPRDDDGKSDSGERLLSEDTVAG